MEAEINDFGVASMFWEEFYGRHIHQLTFYCREFEPGQILKFYFGRELTEDEKRFFYGFIPISAFYWFGWGLYKGSVGDDDSFFFLPAYRNLVRFIDKALASYGLSTEVQ